MTYKATVTKKGQMTIPKKARKALDISKNTQVELEVDKEDNVIKIKNIPDLSEVKGMVENPEQDVLKARERMEKEYRP